MPARLLNSPASPAIVGSFDSIGTIFFRKLPSFAGRRRVRNIATSAELFARLEMPVQLSMPDRRLRFLRQDDLTGSRRVYIDGNSIYAGRSI